MSSAAAAILVILVRNGLEVCFVDRTDVGLKAQDAKVGMVLATLLDIVRRAREARVSGGSSMLICFRRWRGDLHDRARGREDAFDLRWADASGSEW